MYVYLCVRTYACVCMHVCMCMYPWLLVCMYVCMLCICICIYIYMYIHIYIHIYVYTCIYIHIYTYIYMVPAPQRSTKINATTDIVGYFRLQDCPEVCWQNLGSRLKPIEPIEISIGTTIQDPRSKVPREDP